MTSSDGLSLVDAHVHLHLCFDTDEFLRAAHDNFSRTAQELGPRKVERRILVLTDGLEEQGFNRIMRLPLFSRDDEDAADHSWRRRPTKEETSTLITHPTFGELVFVAGRQIRTREGLEVLAIGTRESFGEGEAIDVLVREISGRGLIAVVPWGFGKWLGERGEIVRSLVGNDSLPTFFLGDSGNRPPWWGRPGIFEAAKDHGIRNLPGSDPLPFANENRRPGDMCAAIDGRVGSTTPGLDLKALLLSSDAGIRTCRTRTSTLRILRNQCVIQLDRLW